MKLYFYCILLLGLGLTSGFPQNGVKKGVKDLPSAHIVGGIAVAIKDYQHQLSLRQGGSHICGASILHASWAVTAAHCVPGVNTTTYVNAFTVKGGSASTASGGVVYSLSLIIKHPLNNPSTMDYDVALLKTKTPFSFTATSNMQVIKLVNANAVIADGTNSTVSGWGTTSSGGTVQTLLRAVSVPVTSHAKCVAAYSQEPITVRMLCAGIVNKDSCQGDSGGPLIALNGTTKILIGIVSWGYGCAAASYPGVYTNVTTVTGWIKSTSGNVIV